MAVQYSEIIPVLPADGECEGCLTVYRRQRNGKERIMENGTDHKGYYCRRYS